ncbi:hypothetical protein B0H14DRAFT_3502385 [Mycena olivaceomarginata]|nr:hypothetical protein B0H14DRAFT_3502385 [Mycena olivaceomarginata]
MSEPQRWHAASSFHYAPLMLLRPLDALPPTAHHLGQKETRTGYRVSEENAGQPEGRKDEASVAARGGGWATSNPHHAHQSARGRHGRPRFFEEDLLLGAAMSKRGN